MFAIFFGIMAAACYGGSVFLIQLGSRAGRATPVQGMFINLVAGNVLLLTAMAISSLVEPMAIVWRGVLFFVAAGISGPLLGRVTTFMAVPRIGGTRTSSLAISESLFAGPLAFLFLGQHISWMSGVGIMVIVAGTVLFILETQQSMRTDDGAELLGDMDAEGPLPARGARRIEAAGAVHLPARARAPESPALMAAAGQATSGAVALETVTVPSGSAGRGGVRDAPAALPATGAGKGGQIGLGIVLALSSGFFFAIAGIFRQFGVDAVPSALLGTTIGTFTALVVSTVAFVRSPAAIVGSFRIPRHDLACFIGSGSLSSLGMLAFFWALDAHGTVAISTALKNTSSIFTFFCAAIFLSRKERVSVRLGLLVALVATGAVLAALGRV